SQIASHAGPRADGALYWKAYALNKLGRRDEASAAIDELRKSYGSSRWLEDAKALELEVKQASGKPVTPESESDEEIKLLALNGLMQSDPQRALPLIEGLLKSAQSPALKKRAVYVLAQSDSAQAQQILEQVASGGNNPDLQSVAIRYLSEQRRRNSNTGDLLWKIYGNVNDVSVKRQIVSAFSSIGDREHLGQIARNEKDAGLRLAAIQGLGGTGYETELVKLYQDVGQDTSMRQNIVNIMGNQGNAKALVTLARAERDPQMKKYIVQRLSNMKSSDAADYLLELLK